jgi:hypothetical protein
MVFNTVFSNYNRSHVIKKYKLYKYTKTNNEMKKNSTQTAISKTNGLFQKMFQMRFLYFAAGLTICQKERQIAIGWTGIAAPGQFVPKCKTNGDYQLVQCHLSAGFCWCVGKDGNELPTTRTKGRPICALLGMNM